MKLITKANWNSYVRHCRGKIKHHDEALAEWHRIGLEIKESTEFNKYICDFCDAWHVGHRKFQSAKNKEVI